MNEFRNELSENEKIARMAVGPDTDATHMLFGSERSEKIVNQQKARKFNDEVNDIQDKLDGYMNQLNELGDKITSTMNNLEIMPVYNNIIVEPFKDNPFQQIKVDETTGLITDLGGFAPTYKSEEDGQVHEEEQVIRVGVVIEVGHTCQFVKPGDIVFWSRYSEAPLPFYKTGFIKVSEQNVLAVVNEGLTNRKDSIHGN